MSDYVSSYFSPFAPYACTQNAKASAEVLTVPDGQDSAVLDNNEFLTLKKEVQFRGRNEIAECDASIASGLVECEALEYENWLHRPSVGETAGAPYKQWLAWYLNEKDCL